MTVDPQEPLITALARAFHWQGLIDGGKYASISASGRPDDEVAPGKDPSSKPLRQTSTSTASQTVRVFQDGLSAAGYHESIWDRVLVAFLWNVRVWGSHR